MRSFFAALLIFCLLGACSDQKKSGPVSSGSTVPSPLPQTEEDIEQKSERNKEIPIAAIPAAASRTGWRFSVYSPGEDSTGYFNENSSLIEKKQGMDKTSCSL